MEYVVYGLMIWIILLLSVVPLVLFVSSSLFLLWVVIKKMVGYVKKRDVKTNRIRVEIAVFVAIVTGIYFIYLTRFAIVDIGTPPVTSPDGLHEARVANPGYCGLLCDFHPQIVIKERGRWLNHSKSVASFYKVHPKILEVQWEGNNKVKVYSSGKFGTCFNFDKYKKEMKWKNIDIEYVNCTNSLKSQRMFLEVLKTLSK